MTRCVPEKPHSPKSFSEFPRPFSETRFRYSWANVLSIRERLRRGTIQARFASTSPPSTCCSRMGACESANELVLFFTCMPKELSALPSAWKSTNDDDGYMLCVVVVACCLLFLGRTDLLVITATHTCLCVRVFHKADSTG